ncbi:MAG TPA: methyl-accepting chemotaxis protein [Syntrophorhabdaceae bacterium]|nr:methyl-accepting chemotaxis protein [Syntrophorhabdaceae bacterium]
MASQQGSYCTSDHDSIILPAHWTVRLLEVGESLKDLTGTTEDDFLDMGRQMAASFDEARRIVKTLSSLVELMAGNEITETIEGLERTTQSVGHGLEITQTEFSRKLTALQDTMRAVENVQKPLTSFAKIVKLLVILSISIKIESAQLGSDQAGFLTLADDIERLSVQISEKTAGITLNAQSLRDTVGRNMAHISSIEIRQREHGRTVLDKVNSGLALLRNKNESSRHVTSMISGQSEAVAKHIGEMVSSMQFHDIVRQKVEHVEEAILSFSQEISKDRGGNDKDPSGVDGDDTRLVHEAADICELQTAQLEDSKKQIVAAIGNIKDNLVHISDSVNEIAKEAKNLTGVTDQLSSSFLTEIEGQIGLAVSSLSESSKASQDLSQAMDTFLQTGSVMSGFVDDIEYISDEIQLIALNARVKTAHAGSAGAPLGIIAEAIQKLSSDATQQKMIISDVLTNVISATERIRSYTGNNESDRESETVIVAGELKSLAERLRRVNTQIASLLTNISESSEHLSGNILQTVSHTTVQKRFEEVLASAISNLDTISKEAARIAPEWDEKNREQRLRHYAGKYTMLSERDIHNLVTGFKEEKAGVETGYMGYNAPVATGHTGHSDEGLGDNVELF